MKYKTEPFKDRAELYAWASEKKDIECNGEIFRYVNDGYGLSFNYSISVYKKVIYTKTKQYWLWDICSKNGAWYRSDSFMNENGEYTGGDKCTSKWNELKKRKVEDSLLEIED